MIALRSIIFTAVVTIFVAPAFAGDTWAESMQKMLSQLPNSEGYKLQPAVVKYQENKKGCNQYSGGIHGGARAYKVTIFGDGYAGNGDEDDRKDFARLVKSGALDHPDSLAAAGTIKCGGGTGSAELVDVDSTTPTGKTDGFSIGVTAAHVLIDKNGYRRPDCYYHPMNLPNERYRIAKIKVGDPNSGKFADDWASFVLENDLDLKYGSLYIGSKTEENLREFQNKGGKIINVGYSMKTGMMTVAQNNCGVIVRQSGDINYGNNKLYSNSCDDNGGGSGGGLLASYADNYLLLGINPGGATTYNEKPVGMPFDPKNNVNVTVRFHGAFMNAIKSLARNPY